MGPLWVYWQRPGRQALDRAGPAIHRSGAFSWATRRWPRDAALTGTGEEVGEGAGGSGSGSALAAEVSSASAATALAGVGVLQGSGATTGSLAKLAKGAIGALASPVGWATAAALVMTTSPAGEGSDVVTQQDLDDSRAMSDALAVEGRSLRRYRERALIAAGIPREDWQFYESHHIAAVGAREAAPARKVLLELGIDINDLANQVPLRTQYHHQLHRAALRNTYYSDVNGALQNGWP